MLVDELTYKLKHVEEYIPKLQALPDFDKSNSIIKGYLTVDKGTPMVNYHCTQCGHEESVPGSYVSSFYKCPSCGNGHIVMSSYTTFRSNNLYIEETPDGFVAIDYGIAVRFPYSDTWYLETAETCAVPHTMYIYDRNASAIVVGQRECNITSVLGNGNKADMSIRTLLSTRYNVAGIAAERWEELTNEVSKMRQQKEQAKREKAKSRVVVDDYAEYQASDVDTNAFARSIHMRIYTVYDRNAAGVINRVWCTRCGGHYDMVADDNNTICPHCGTNYATDENCYPSMIRDSINTNYIVFENTNLPGNDLLIRLFRVSYSVLKNESGELELRKNVIEEQRLFFGDKIRVYGWDGAPCTKKATIKNISYRFRDCANGYDGTVCVQPNTEILEIISKSCMKYSGLAESWGLVENYTGLGKICYFGYIKAWYKYPQLELLVKANIPRITYDYISRIERDSWFAVPQGKNVCEILGISKTALKAAREHNMSKDDVKYFDRFLQAEPATTYEKFHMIQGQFNDLSRFLNLNHKYKISFDSMLHYLDSVYDHQCIVRPEALNVWWDYLNMASDLSMDLTQKSLLYPRSLKKEHDIAVFAYNAMKRVINAQKFAETAKINKERYEYADGDFLVKIPECPEDIIEEASKQHNCLRSYIERVRDGYTTVAFVRRQSAPEDSYVSVEIYENKLYQVKLAYNQDPHDKDLSKFLQRWCTTCDIEPNNMIK